MIYSQPSARFLGICIDEPIGTLTDVIVSIVCFYAFYILTKYNRPERSHLYLRYYFLLMGVATLLGGVVGHGFLYALSFSWKLPGWIIGIVSVTLIERSAISHARPLIKPKIGKFFLVFNLVEMVVIIVVTITTLNFKWVQVHSGYGLLANVATFHAYIYYKTRDPGSLVTLIAVGITVVASIVFVNELSIHTWFNFLDISHSILAIAAYVFLIGAQRLYPTEKLEEVHNSNRALAIKV